MKRAILLLATALLGVAGCTSHACRETSITVQWAFQSPTSGLLDCSSAGVTTAHVFLDGVQQVDQLGSGEFTCTDFPNGVILPNFPGGSHALQIDAFDSAGQLLYQYRNTIQAVSCGDTRLPIDVPAVQGQLVIQFAIPGNQCPPNSFIWYSITDVTDPAHPQVFDFIDGTKTPTAITCTSTGRQIGFDKVLFGNYQLDFLQVVTPTGSNPPFAADFSTSTAFSLPHNSDDAFQVQLVDCTAQPASCPAPQ